MIAAVGCALAAASAVGLLRRGVPGSARLRPPVTRPARRPGTRSDGRVEGSAGRSRMGLSAPRLARAGGVLTGVALAVAGLGLTGLLLGLAAAAVLPGVLARAEPAAVGRTRRALVAELPLAVDLVAAAIAAGAQPAAALEQVGRVLPGVLGGRLVVTARALRLGADPVTGWAPALAGGGESLRGVADAFAGARTDGSALAERLSRVALDVREAAAAASLAAAQRAGIRAVAPLGLCFLPAFVAVGVVPVVAASLGRLGW